VARPLQEQETLLLSELSRPATGHIHSPIQWVSEDVSLGVRRSEREADHSFSSNIEVKG
jgi:hypothetical protein